MKKSTKSDS